jgi:uncharacterized protein
MWKISLLLLILGFSGCKSKSNDNEKPKVKTGKTEIAKQNGIPTKINLPLPIKGIEDKTSFSILVNGKTFSTSMCHLKKDGSFERSTTVNYAGQTIKKSSKIKSDKDGKWSSIELTTSNGITTVNRNGEDIEIHNKKKDKKFSLKGKSDHLIFDSNCLVFENFIFSKYDHKKGGKQNFMRFLIPQKMDNMEVEQKEDVTVSNSGKKVLFKRYNYNVMGIEMLLWVKDNKVCQLKIPLQNATIIRKGYEYLNVDTSKDPLLSKAIHKVEKNTIMVPMRDKIELATDIYKPTGIKQQLPLILIRTPYKKELNELDANYFASRGYAVAVQDVRGRFSSKGKWVPFFNEAKDGHDAIEWLAKQPWCNGKVGMIGGSYVGWVQLWAATENPKHLITIIPNVAPPGPFYNIPYEYGVFFIFGSIWWAEILETNATGDVSGAKFSKISDRRYEKELMKLPVIDLDKSILGKENKYWRAWIKNNKNGPYWARANLKEKLKKVKIPVFLQSGWFDGDGIGSKLNYESLKAGGNKNIKLILGPWGHTAKSKRRLGDIDFTKAATPDLQVMYLRWFDYWLKGIKNKIMDEPKVQLFTMFSNKWANGNNYPLKTTTFENLYISSTKGAQSSKGDGKLSFNKPTGGAQFDQYVYDPGAPTPAPDFYFKDKNDLKKEKTGQAIDIEKNKKKKQMNHKMVSEKRKDILVYETTVLKKNITIAGPVSAVLYASSDAKDTDWFVSLSVVQKNGRVLALVRGKIRARFRESMFKETFLQKNKVYKYVLDLWQTGITFKKGEKIRVEITSAAFPLFSRNLNTGGHNEMETKFQKANQKIHHTKKHPTHIILPVLKK